MCFAQVQLSPRPGATPLGFVSGRGKYRGSVMLYLGDTAHLAGGISLKLAGRCRDTVISRLSDLRHRARKHSDKHAENSFSSPPGVRPSPSRRKSYEKSFRIVLSVKNTASSAFLFVCHWPELSFGRSIQSAFLFIEEAEQR